MDNTYNHKWYHNIKRLWCYAWGHNMFCGSEYDTKLKHRTYDYCRRCEGIIGEPRWHNGPKHFSFNFGIRLLIIKVKLHSLINKELSND